MKYLSDLISNDMWIQYSMFKNYSIQSCEMETRVYMCVCFFKNKLKYKNKSVILFLQPYIVYISLGRRPVNLYYYNTTWFSKDTKLLKKIKFNEKNKQRRMG